MANTERLAQLRQNLVEHFDLEELRALCFDLRLDYDELRGEGQEAKARELVSYLECLRPFDFSPRVTCNRYHLKSVILSDPSALLRAGAKNLIAAS
jgi:hypothetical protein